MKLTTQNLNNTTKLRTHYIVHYISNSFEHSKFFTSLYVLRGVEIYLIVSSWYYGPEIRLWRAARVVHYQWETLSNQLTYWDELSLSKELTCFRFKCKSSTTDVFPCQDRSALQILQLTAFLAMFRRLKYSHSLDVFCHDGLAMALLFISFPLWKRWCLASRLSLVSNRGAAQWRHQQINN